MDTKHAEAHSLAVGERVVLRDTRPSDVDTYLYWQTHGEWREWDAPWATLATPEQLSAFKGRFLAAVARTPALPRSRATITTKDGKPLGWVNRYSPEDCPDAWYVGIDICEDAYLNRGIGTEALRLWVDYLFKALGVDHIGLETWSFNKRMMRSPSAPQADSCFQVGLAYPKRWAKYQVL